MEQEVPVNTSYSLETCLEQSRASECEEAEQAQVESPFQEREGWNPMPPPPPHVWAVKVELGRLPPCIWAVKTPYPVHGISTQPRGREHGKAQSHLFGGFDFMRRGHEVPGIEPGAPAVQSPLRFLPISHIPTSLGVSLAWHGTSHGNHATLRPCSHPPCSRDSGEGVRMALHLP